MSSSAAGGASGGLTLVLASPSGAGKTTLKNRLLSEHPGLRFSVSHTTRPRRVHETNGREYHFVDRAVFEQMIAQREFAEHASVFGNLYGTSMEQLRLAPPGHRGVVLDLDVQGVRQLKARHPEAVSVFILPPSFAELERRLRARADEPDESIRRRLGEARVEIAHYAMFDYLIVNDDLEAAARELGAVVVAEQARRTRRAVAAEGLLTESLPVLGGPAAPVAR